MLPPEDPPVLLPAPELDPVPVLPAPEPVLLPEPMPPELEPPGALLPGVEVLLPDVPPELAPPVVPLELLPLVMPSSLRHLSRSAPTMPRHLLLLLPLALPEDDAPPEALLSDDPVELPPVALGVLLLELPVALGVLLLELPPTELPVALGVLLDELPPLAPLPVELLPVALGVLDPAALPPVLPADEPELCANEAPAIAKSAAAVAVTTSFIFTVGPPKERGRNCRREVRNEHAWHETSLLSPDAHSNPNPVRRRCHVCCSGICSPTRVAGATR